MCASLCGCFMIGFTFGIWILRLCGLYCVALSGLNGFDLGYGLPGDSSYVGLLLRFSCCFVDWRLLCVRCVWGLGFLFGIGFRFLLKLDWFSLRCCFLSYSFSFDYLVFLLIVSLDLRFRGDVIYVCFKFGGFMSLISFCVLMLCCFDCSCDCLFGIYLVCFNVIVWFGY